MNTTPSPETAEEHNQTSLKIENEKYLRAHPELSAVLTTVMKEILMHQPEDPVAFLENYLLTSDLHAVYVEGKM